MNKIHVRRMNEGVLLCFIKPISGNRYGPGVSSRASRGVTLQSSQTSAGGRESLVRRLQKERETHMVCREERESSQTSAKREGDSYGLQGGERV